MLDYIKILWYINIVLFDKGACEMNVEEAINFLDKNKKYFPINKREVMIAKLINSDKDNIELLNAVKFKNPSFYLLLSVLAGIFGVDRFLIGDIKIGFIKLLTMGGFGILLLYDWLLIYQKIKLINYKTLISICMYNNGIG